MVPNLSGVQVYLALGYTDMRKSINGLSAIVSQRMSLNPLSGNLFAFTNKSRNILKVLYWDRNGFCLWQKRLEKDVFRWPRDEKDVLNISHRELMWLIDGLDIHRVTAHKTLSCSVVC